MTLLLDRHVIGPKTHAFVVGVGNYPFARAGQGVDADLRSVPPYRALQIAQNLSATGYSIIKIALPRRWQHSMY
jgi:hypothetical protein